jgi:hypothetical protein
MSTKLEQIEALSEQNSLESIQTLLELMKDETLSEEEVEAAEEAFETVSFLYALPENEEEERDVKLCELIAKRLDLLQDLAFDFYEEEQNLERAKLESEVATHMLEKADAEQKEDRQTDLDASIMLTEMANDACVQIEEEIKMTNEWIDCAHEMLATEKYRALPQECFEVLFPADEDEDEEEYNCCGGDDCGNEECEGCDDCMGGCNGEGCEGGCEEDVLEEVEEVQDGCCGGGCCKG